MAAGKAPDRHGADGTMEMQTQMRARLSALADGELDQSERELALAALATPEGQYYWRAYQLLGDTLRQEAEQAAGASEQRAFQGRLTQKLAAEPDPASGHASQDEGDILASKPDVTLP